jgi:hypothetical protein
VGAWLLLRLWSYGADVQLAPGGAVIVTAHPSGRRIPDVLRAAVHRHRAALAAWFAGDPEAPVIFVESCR